MHRQAIAIFAAVRAYRKDHSAENPTSTEQLRPYVSEPTLLDGISLANGGDSIHYDHGMPKSKSR